MPRWIEFPIALISLVLLSPFLLATALWIRLDSAGPALYKAFRAGRGGKPFVMHKFRTMASSAEGNGPPLTTRGDLRVTWAGRWLRKTKINELPQLWNVLNGDMRFVGPRPEDPDIVRRYSEEQRRILKFRPGITSPASILYRTEEEIIPSGRWEHVYFRDILPKKLDADLRYMERATPFSDLKVIFETVFKR